MKRLKGKESMSMIKRTEKRGRMKRKRIERKQTGRERKRL